MLSHQTYLLLLIPALSTTTLALPQTVTGPHDPDDFGADPSSAPHSANIAATGQTPNSPVSPPQRSKPNA